ncbi:BTAD domain-containing putative transcriptional regulator [Actinopolymorpha sp. B11F2]|uniref:BTAD domain-containing putative transcriptional regulator n=1 Tax=Actinopolymorpha sp. B11F2 TaxID=3160862 RepID=UPI0032E3EEB6
MLHHAGGVRMDYRLLGPVEVCDQGTAVPIGGPRQRTVLAVLALNLDRVVPVRALVDAVWDGSAPVTAHGQILTAVSALRRSLGAAIETRSTGYLLHADPDDVDVHSFERLAAEACELNAAGHLDACVARLRAALALWRGPALGGVRRLAAEATRLEERRLLVLERCLEAELAMGRHADRVGELLALTDSHPFRERFRALLMRALHHLGRQAEALDCYRSGRRLLVEELGIEPGPELQRLHKTILAGGHDPVPGATDVFGQPSTPIRPTTAVGVPGSAAPPSTERVVQQHVPGPTWYQDPPRPVRRVFFGVTLNSTSGRMPDFRVGAVRLWDCSCRWSNIQPHREVFDWQTLDRLVTGARDVDLPVLYTMGLPAGWACPDAKRAPYLEDCRAAAPDDLTDWDAYVHTTVTRYRGRIEAYELWDYVNSPMWYTGDADTLAEMVRRAARIIKDVDPAALVVSPSFGDLWDPAVREQLRLYAEAGVLELCDAVAVKLHPREPSGPPEEMIELSTLIDRTLHSVGAQRLLWATGPSHNMVHAPRLDQATAEAYAVRQFLVGIFARCERMYFYNWGNRTLPIVLQAEGGPPTQAAWSVDRVQHWLADAYVRSASHGSDDNLPPNVWQLRFVFPSSPGGGPPDRSSSEAVIRWTDTGTASMPAEPDTDRIEHLNGTVEPAVPGSNVHVTELPIIIRYHQRRLPSSDS